MHGTPEAGRGTCEPEPLFFILTNSRALPEDRAAALNREIAGNLLDASREQACYGIASRSDSTLRGHFPTETDALAHELGGIDGVLICPAFFEGGRITAGDVHFVREGDRVVPAAETEFARDATFGYRAATLPGVGGGEDGSIKTDDVAALTLKIFAKEERAGRGSAARGARPAVVVNALDYPDLWTLCSVCTGGSGGKQFLYPTGASFVRARPASMRGHCWRRDELLGARRAGPARGWSSSARMYGRTTEQLERLLLDPGDDRNRGRGAWAPSRRRRSAAERSPGLAVR